MKEKLQEYAFIAEIIGGMAIVASLIFVGLQIQQTANETALNTRAIQGATYQAMSDAAVSVYSESLHDSKLMEVMNRVYDGKNDEDFNAEENMQIAFYYFAYQQRLENTYLQYKSGLVDENVFQSYGWNDAIFRTPHFREYWEVIGKYRASSSEFVNFFENKMKQPVPTLKAWE